MSQDAPGCLGALFRLLGLTGSGGENGKEPAKADVFRVRDDFLSPAEASFFRVLKLTVDERYLICPKVGLGDLFYVTRPQENPGARNRIDRKHVDFLLCDPNTLKPLLGLELDDVSHRKAQNVARDEWKEAVFKAAGLPLLRVPVQAAYEPAQLAALLSQVSGSQAAAITADAPVGAAAQHPPAPPPAPNEAPECPKCGTPMVQRTAQRGDQCGNRFWGCPNYPRCRQVIACSLE